MHTHGLGKTSRGSSDSCCLLSFVFFSRGFKFEQKNKTKNKKRRWVIIFCVAIIVQLRPFFFFFFLGGSRDSIALRT